jgi:proteasome lid subunit RPN8/RPN11
MSDTFTCQVDGVSACSRAPQPQIFVDARIWESIVGLCQRVNTEWLAYLIGEKDEHGNYEVKSLSFPEQTAGGAHVQNQPSADFRADANTIGAIHSHVNMKAFFSSTDVAHANWPVEIVVNAKGEYETSVRVTLPCGESMRRKASVVLLTGGQLDTMESALKEALEKGKAKEATHTQAVVVWPGGEYSGYGYAGGSYHYGGAYHAARQNDEPRLLGGKYLNCPVCGQKAISCPHSLAVMEQHEEKQKQVNP